MSTPALQSTVSGIIDESRRIVTCARVGSLHRVVASRYTLMVSTVFCIECEPAPVLALHRPMLFAQVAVDDRATIDDGRRPLRAF